MAILDVMSSSAPRDCSLPATGFAKRTSLTSGFALLLGASSHAKMASGLVEFSPTVHTRKPKSSEDRRYIGFDGDYLVNSCLLSFVHWVMALVNPMLRILT